MDARVSRLETHIEYISRDLADVKESLRETAKAIADLSKAISELKSELKELPTKHDLWSWKIQWLIIALAAFATIVGGIIGGLDWIKTH